MRFRHTADGRRIAAALSPGIEGEGGARGAYSAAVFTAIGSPVISVGAPAA